MPYPELCTEALDDVALLQELTALLCAYEAEQLAVLFSSNRKCTREARMARVEDNIRKTKWEIEVVRCKIGLGFSVNPLDQARVVKEEEKKSG